MRGASSVGASSKSAAAASASGAVNCPVVGPARTPRNAAFGDLSATQGRQSLLQSAIRTGDVLRRAHLIPRARGFAVPSLPDEFRLRICFDRHHREYRTPVYCSSTPIKDAVWPPRKHRSPSGLRATR